MTVNPDQDVEPYPGNMVIGVIDDPADVRTTADGLQQAGFDEAEVVVLCGAEGIDFLDVGGGHHGLLGRVVRTVQRFGVERDQLERLAEELRQGHFAIGVRVADDAGKQRVSELLQQHGAHYIHYYGPWTIERLAA